MTTRERPKRSEVRTPGNTPTRKQRSVSPATAKIQIEGRRLPDNIYVPRKKGPPKGNLPDGAKSLTAAGNASVNGDQKARKRGDVAEVFKTFCALSQLR